MRPPRDFRPASATKPNLPRKLVKSGKGAGAHVAAVGVRDAVAHGLALVFSGEGAKPTIPNEQHATVVASVLAMVHAVMRLRIQQPFERHRQSSYGLGVDPNFTPAS